MLLQCSFADCVNYKKSQEPFYLHHPSSAGGHLQQQQQHQHQHQYQQQQQQQHQQQQNGTGRGKVAVKDGLYVVSPAAAAAAAAAAVQQQQQQHQQQIVTGKTVTSAAAPVTVEPVKQQQQGPFYLHSPNGTIDDPVKDIFLADKTVVKTTAYVAPPPPPLPAIGLNTMTGKPRSIISSNIILYTTIIAYRHREICTILFFMFFMTHIFLKKKLVLHDFHAPTPQCNDNRIIRTCSKFKKKMHLYDHKIEKFHKRL